MVIPTDPIEVSGVWLTESEYNRLEKFASQYDHLKERDFMLTCLEDGGVDNWEWYSESLEPYWKRYPDPDFEDEEDE